MHNHEWMNQRTLEGMQTCILWGDVAALDAPTACESFAVIALKSHCESYILELEDDMISFFYAYSISLLIYYQHHTR